MLHRCTQIHLVKVRVRDFVYRQRSTKGLTDAFEDLAERSERLGVRVCAMLSIQLTNLTGMKYGDIQVVRARLRRVGAKCRGEEGDVRFLMRRNLSKARAHPVGEPRLGKVRRAEARQGARVERVLEVLEGQRVVEDGRVYKN